MFIFKKIASLFQKQPKRILSESGIIYILNESEKTAILEKDKTSKGDIIIPRSIMYESKEYIVTSIKSYAFNGSIDIDTIRFPEDSEVTEIGEGSFFYSSIYSISLPPKLTEIPTLFISRCQNIQNIEIPENSELKVIKGYAFDKSNITSLTIPPKTELLANWCSGTPYLIDISISPENHRYGKYLGQFVIEKTDENAEIFDSLIFVPRNIESIVIPSFIKRISSCALEMCNNLKNVEFSESSELIIDESSFSYSSLNFISIPSFVTLIGKSAFYRCNKLKKVNFEGQSRLNVIDKFAFSFTKIERLFVPSSVSKIGKSAFEGCNLHVVEFDENSKLETIDSYAFSKTMISSIVIPSSVKEIGSEVFPVSMNFIIIEISEFSQFETFKINLPQNVIVMVPPNLNKI